MAVASNKKKKIFDKRYEILSIVGRGARSVVYHARYIDGDREEVALKVLLDKREGITPSDLLRKEALAMVSSRHKYVIRLDDFHSLGDLCYLTMELAKLGDLRQYLKKKNGKLSATQTELFLLQAGEALDFIHKAGILHRDLKPENLLVVDDQNIRIGDFGVAMLPGEKSSLEELRNGVGTLDYLSPEVLDGTSFDKRSDLYSLGVTFYELLSGVHPFENAPLAEQIEARKNGNFTPISEREPDAPAHLRSAIHRLMSFDAEERFQTARDLIQALVSFDVSGLEDESSQAPKVTPKSTPAPEPTPEPQAKVTPKETPKRKAQKEQPVAKESAKEPELKETSPEESRSKQEVPKESSPNESAPEESAPPKRRRRRRKRKSAAQSSSAGIALSDTNSTDTPEAVEESPNELSSEIDRAVRDEAEARGERKKAPKEEAPATPDSVSQIQQAVAAEATQPAPVEPSEPEPVAEPTLEPTPEPVHEVPPTEDKQPEVDPFPSEPTPKEKEEDATEESSLDASPTEQMAQGPYAASSAERYESQREEVAEEQVRPQPGRKRDKKKKSRSRKGSSGAASLLRQPPKSNAQSKMIVAAIIGVGLLYATSQFLGGSDDATTPADPAQTGSTQVQQVDNTQVAPQTPPETGIIVDTPSMTQQQQQVPQQQVIPQQQQQIVPAAKQLFPKPAAVPESFPIVPAGMYSGQITSSRTGKAVPFSLIKLQSSNQLIMAIGIHGFEPVVIDLASADQNTGTIRVVSQGLVLKVDGAANGGTLSGTLTNEVTGEVSTWRASP